MKQVALVWFRRDLRLADNPALTAAVEQNDAVLPVYIDEQPGERGAASNVWLHQSLESFSQQFEQFGSRLILRRGNCLEMLQELRKESGASRIYWNRLYEPRTIERDRRIKETLTDAGIEVHSLSGALLYEPWNVQNKQGKPYRVYTPFWRELESRGVPDEPLMPVDEIPAPESWPLSLALEDFALLPRIQWHKEILQSWQPGEPGALARLEAFVEDGAEAYGKRRDFPAEPSTSGLSPHLHFGEISPRAVFHEVLSRVSTVTPYLRQIVWREFAHHLLFHFPETVEENMNRSFDRFPWRESPEDLKAWQEGQTGYPIVDAGMRELWHTGWMHNRVRMIVGSFLVKDLMIHWHEGARWFWDTLVDADLANNTMGWQWIAGCGADAAPYFRVFNPVTQGEKFDANGEYVARWVPELKKMPKKFIHKPWEAPAGILKQAGVELGENYPSPMVDHAKARLDALDAYQSIKAQND